jgi:S1-C subfamily serine protease
LIVAARQPARTPDDLFDALAAARSGTLELKVVRGTDERTLQVTFTEPDQNA